VPAAQAFSAAVLRFVDASDESQPLSSGRNSHLSGWIESALQGLTLTLRQPSMLAGMSIPPATDRAQGPAIQVQGLEKSYKELRVLRGVDFEVARGSIFALLGSNGAGKTTVVKILSTLLAADAGIARVNGFDVATQAAGAAAWTSR